MMSLVWLLMILAALALLVVPLMRRNRGPRGEMLRGTLLVTGVSGSKSGADSTGKQLATLTGVINGPTVNEHVVYQQMEITPEAMPRMGQLIDVVYSPKNPDNWFFAPPEQQLPPAV